MFCSLDENNSLISTIRRFSVYILCRITHHLQSVYLIYYLLLDKHNVHTEYFLGFSVYISNSTNKEDGVLCFRDTNYTKATIPNPVNITCPYHGRYVIYYNNRTRRPYPEGYSGSAWIAPLKWKCTVRSMKM